MKIIKPYGYAHVKHDNNQKLTRQFFDTKNDPQKDLLDIMNDEDALLAVWASTLDKVFGKPKNKDLKNDPTNLKIKANDLSILRQSVADAVISHLKKKRGLQASTTAQSKWNNKLALSTTAASSKHSQGKPKKISGKPCCFGGRLFFKIMHSDFDNYKMKSDLPHPNAIINRMDAYIHGTVGILGKRIKSVEKNVPDTSRMTQIQTQTQTTAASTPINQGSHALRQHFNDDTWEQYKGSDAESDVFKSIYDECTKDVSTAGNASQFQKWYLNIPKSKAIINEALRKHSEHHLFPKNDYPSISAIKTACETDSNLREKFELHQAIREFYKRLLSRPKLFVHLLPKDQTAMQNKLSQRKGNIEISELIRMGKVLHHHWMHISANNSNGDAYPSFAQLKDISQTDFEQSVFWSTDGQIRIKQNESFIRIWRQIMGLASMSLAQWADPTWRRLQLPNPQTDILGVKPLSAVFDVNNNDHTQAFSAYAQLIFGDQNLAKNAQSLTAHALDFLTHLQSLLSQVRNQAYHFKGLPLFLNNSTWELPTTNGAISNAQTIFSGILERDLNEEATHLFNIIQSLKWTECLNQHDMQTLLPHLLPLSGEAFEQGFMLPRFQKLLNRGMSTNISLFKTLKDMPSTASIWQRCHFELFKRVYENGFLTYLNNNSAQCFKSWAQKAMGQTDDTAQKITKDAAVMSKVSKIFTDALTKDCNHLQDYLSKIVEQSQTLGEDMTEQDQHQAYAIAIENFKQDIIIQAWLAYLSQNNEALRQIFVKSASQAQGIKDAIKIKDAENDLETKIKEHFQNNQAHQDLKTDAAASNIYAVLHLIPPDALSMFKHQLIKSHVLSNQNVSSNTKSATHIDPEQTKLMTRFVVLINLHLMVAQAKYSGGVVNDISDQDRSKLRSLYANHDQVTKLFSQNNTDASGTQINWIPRRHWREMSRFGGMALIDHRPEGLKISEQTVMDWQAVNSDKLAKAQINREDLHKKWVKEKEKEKSKFVGNNKESYKSSLNTISTHKHLTSTVLLQDEFKRYQLAMKVLTRLADYAGMWERDVIFLMTLAIHRCFHLQQQCGHIGTINNKDFTQMMFKGKNAKVWDQHFRTLTQGCSTANCTLVNNDPMIQSIQKHLSEMKQQKGHRNRFAHFNMLGEDKPLNLRQEVNLARSLMSHDRKLKSAVTPSILDMLKDEGLDLDENSMVFSDHQWQKLVAAKDQNIAPKCKTISHFGKESGVTEAQLSDHYVKLMLDLFS